LNIVWTGQFKKDYRRSKKQHKDMTALCSILDRLLEGEPLSPRHRDHSLSGEWKNHRECHITPDWLLIYRVEGKDLILERMGSQSELLK